MISISRLMNSKHRHRNVPMSDFKTTNLSHSFYKNWSIVMQNPTKNEQIAITPKFIVKPSIPIHPYLSNKTCFKINDLTILIPIKYLKVQITLLIEARTYTPHTGTGL